MSGCAFLLDLVGVLALIGQRGDAEHQVLDGCDVIPPDDDVNNGGASRFCNCGSRIIIIDHVRSRIGCTVGKLGLEE